MELGKVRSGPLAYKGGRLLDPGLDVLDPEPIIDISFGNGGPYCHKITTPGYTFSRASSALDYSKVPAVLVGNNVARYAKSPYLQGLLIEGSDTNLITQNTIYNVVNWTLHGGAGLTVTDDTSHDLYGGHNFQIYNAAMGYKGISQRPTLTAAKYVLSCIAFSAMDDQIWNQLKFAMAVAPGDLTLAANNKTPNYEQIGTIYSTYDGSIVPVYLCWYVFTGTAAQWDVGLSCNATGVINITCFTCHLASPTSEGGDFPRSPIPNATGASITRAADLLTIPADGNVGKEGTIDLEYISTNTGNPTANLYLIDIYVDANNRLRFFKDLTDAHWYFYHTVAGTGVVTYALLSESRGCIIKARLCYGSNISGTRDLLFYASVAGGAWALKHYANGPIGGSFPTGGTCYIGSTYANNRHLGSFIRRFRAYNQPIIGVPGW